MARAERGEFRACSNDVNLPPVNTVGDVRIRGARGFSIGYDDPDTGVRVFHVHFYMFADFRIGGSGMKDPKWLCEDGIAYIADKSVPRLEPT